MIALLLLLSCGTKYAPQQGLNDCDGWVEVPSLLINERCFLYETGEYPGYGGIACYPRMEISFKDCVADL